MNAMVKTAAAEIAAAIRASGVSMDAIVAALSEADKSGSRLISTQAQAEKAAPGIHRVKDAVGLYLKKGARSGSWFRRYWFGGKRREMGLGPLAKTSLVEARKRAREFDTQRDAGNDPIEIKRAAKAEAGVKAEAEAAALASGRWTFETATEEYLKRHASSWRHHDARRTWHNPIVKYAYPVIGKMQLDLIRVEHIDAIMTAATKGGAPKVAPRIRLRIEQVISTAMALGRCDATRSNPAAVVKEVRPKSPKIARKHFRRIALDAAPATFRRLAALAETSTPLSALVFMIATAARPSEALNARWDQIDLEKKLWMNPVSKTGKLLPVPLSPITLAVLERQARVRMGDAVFLGRGGSPASYAAFSVASRTMGFDIGNPHAWRSIFRDATEDICGFRRETIEAALGHSLGAVEAAYRRETGVEARRAVMEAYAKWLMGEGANVIAFKSRA
jgi:integrase